jgi:DNA segregation ATPase FtsK/SpoIIIE, S-DNA-T family
VAIGHDVAGKPIVQDMTRWPHAIVAGATGTGKSVMLNAIIASLLFRCSPSECRMIMIDPKMVELSQYNGIPHLLTPVVTDYETKAVSAFAWAVAEMDRRYKEFSAVGARNIESFNQMSGFQAEPYIVIVVDELADMMMVAASEIEKYIIRLAQKSRAIGIHLILATQRPSVNIITGTIKANVPTRMAFKVTSLVDSRVIIDQAGAETLIGRGDMLYTPPDDSKPKRVQGAFISDKEISALVNYLKNSGVEPDYKKEIFEQKVISNKLDGNIEGADEKLVRALEIVIQDGKASASYLQRKLGIGYSRAARMIDDMEDANVIGQARGSKPRDVLVANVDEALARMGDYKLPPE